MFRSAKKLSFKNIDMKKLYWTVLFPSLFYVVRRNVSFLALLQYGNHTEVFFYLASVDNFRLLNPTIINITHWEQASESSFYVEYTEYLSQARTVTNYGQAHYQIEQKDDESYNLLSQHSTCFLTDFLCLSTESKLHVTKLAKGEVGYKEAISYSCPWILLKFCFNEVAMQRKFIITKLKELFHNSDKK